MNIEHPLSTIFKHHLWANLVIYDLCCELSDEQLDASVPGVFGTIRETLNHIMRAERSYFSRITTGKPSEQPENTLNLSISAMRIEIETTGKGLIEWALKVKGDEMVELNWDGYPREVPKPIILNQAINHATEHRSQILTILTALGLEPPEVSSWSFYEAVSDWE